MASRSGAVANDKEPRIYKASYKGRCYFSREGHDISVIEINGRTLVLFRSFCWDADKFNSPVINMDEAYIRTMYSRPLPNIIINNLTTKEKVDDSAKLYHNGEQTGVQWV